MMDKIAHRLQQPGGLKFLELERRVQNNDTGFPSLIEALQDNKKVRYVYICGEFFDSLDTAQRQGLLKATGTLGSLQCLYISNAKLTFDAVQDLACSFSTSICASLQEISFQHLHLADGVVLDGMIKSIAKFPVLERVEIGVLFMRHDQAALSPEALAELCQSSSVKALTLIDLRLDQRHFQAMAQALSKSISLAELSIWGEELRYACCTSFAEMLRKNNSLRSLSLYFGTVDNDGIVAISDSIGQHPKIRSFSIENEDMSITNNGVIAMSRMLEQNTQMESLSLTSKGLDDEGCISLCKALESHPNLRELSLDTAESTNEGEVTNDYKASLQRAGFDAMSNMLQVNTSIQRLDLSGMTIDEAELEVLIASLWKNSTLRELCLGSLKLDAGAGKTYEQKLANVFSMLEDMLEHNTVLEKISTEEDTLTINFGGKIDLLLSLNKRGLRTLMVDVNESRVSFLEKLVENSYSDDVSFHLLSTNPSLINVE